MIPLIVAGNWKLNKGPMAARSFLKDFLAGLEPEEHGHFWIFPSNLSLAVASEMLGGTEVGWGAQNVFKKNEGAFTGENSGAVLKEMGATHCLVGHSERRSVFHESSEEVAEKVKLLQDLDICPVVCIGETLAERDAGRTWEVVQLQLVEGLKHLNPNAPMALAYEPVWAIGTGRVATPAEAGEVHDKIREWLVQRGGEDWAKKTPILYGGSVKPDNAQSLYEQENIDGFLVGGASLEASGFTEIYRRCLKA